MGYGRMVCRSSSEKPELSSNGSELSSDLSIVPSSDAKALSLSEESMPPKLSWGRRCGNLRALGEIAVAKSSSQLSSPANTGERKRSVDLIEVGDGRLSTNGLFRVDGRPEVLGWSGLCFFFVVPVSGDRKASFHSWTLLTASSYSVDFLGITDSVLRALTIHGCLSNFLAETRRFGSFWKHCMRKSFTA